MAETPSSEAEILKLSTVTRLADQVKRTRDQMKVLCGQFYAARTAPYRSAIAKRRKSTKRSVAAVSLEIVKQVERDSCPIKLALAIAAATDAMEESCG